MIVHAVATYGPGKNAIVLDGLERAVKRYPYANCFIYDRARKFLKDATISDPIAGDKDVRDRQVSLTRPQGVVPRKPICSTGGDGPPARNEHCCCGEDVFMVPRLGA